MLASAQTAIHARPSTSGFANLLTRYTVRVHNIGHPECPPSLFQLPTSAAPRFLRFFPAINLCLLRSSLTHHYYRGSLFSLSTPRHNKDSPIHQSPDLHCQSLMTPRSSSSAPPRLNRHQERSLSLQLVPRSIPTRQQPPTAHSSHYRSPSPSRFPRFEETSVSEKSRCDGVFEASPTKAEASTPWDEAPGPQSSLHQSSLRHLTHQNSACPDYPLSPIQDTASAQFAIPLPSLHSGYLHPPRKIRLWSILKPWLPVLAYVSTSLGFVIAIAFWKTQVFEGALYYPIFPARSICYLRPFIPSQLRISPAYVFLSTPAALDDLSNWLKADKNFGYGVLFFLIFITTFRK